MCQRRNRPRRRAKCVRLRSQFGRHARAEVLEARLALSGQSAVGDLLAGPAQPFPDGLSHADPLIRAAIAGITTTAPSDQLFFLDDFQPGPLSPAPTGLPGAALAESGELIELPAFRNDPRFAGIDGSGYSVVVLDTGIDLDHPFFGPDSNGDDIADRILFNADFITGRPNADDVRGHGTHVSSIIGSQDTIYGGIAPGSGIISLRVLDDSGFGTAEAIESALQWVVANAQTYNVASVNLSLSFGDNRASAAARPDLGFSDELAALAAQGVITVSASGNFFSSFESAPGVSYPSYDPNSLSIGAVWDADVGGPISWGSGAEDNTTGVDRIVSFSQRHPTLSTVFAPGALITAAAIGGGTSVRSGTSMAAPHVAGIAAVMQQLSVQLTGERLSVADFAELVKLTGVPILDGDDEDDNVINTQQEFHRLDTLALANAIASDGLSDLSVAGDIEIDSPTVAVGGRARVDFTIANQGLSSTGAFSSKLYLSADSVIDESDIFLGSVADSLGSGNASRREGYLVDLPAFVAPGDYFLGLVVEDQSVVTESNEQNNVAFASISVVVDLPEVWIFDVTDGSEIGDGGLAIDFGQIGPGGADVVRTFRISNDGSIDLHLDQPMAPAGFVMVGFPEVVPPLADAEFTILLPANNNDGQYAGEISFVSNDADESPFNFVVTGAVDHGDNAAAATPITSNSSVQSTIGTPGDRDWYRFNAVRGVEYQMETLLGTLEDSVLRLLNASSNQIAFDDNGGGGLGSSIIWTAPSDGVYYIEVSGNGGTGTYQLSFAAGDDHGNGAATATATTDPSVNPGALEAPGDLDWFSFAALAGTVYRFEMALGTLPGSVLRLIDIDGTTQLASYASGALESAPLVEWTAPESGIYYLAVEGSAPSMIGSYALTITGADDYGDNAPNATAVSLPDAIPGVLEEARDVDWFSFNAVGGAQYEFVVSASGGANSLIRLISQGGVTELARDDESGPGSAPHIVWTAPASGIYFIEVSDIDERIGSYELSLVIIDDHGDDAPGAMATTDPIANPGVIELPDNVDWFSFEGFAGVSYRLEAVLGELSSSTLRLIDTDGGTVLATNSPGPAETPLIEWTADHSGRFYVEVSAAAGAQLGSYWLMIFGDDDHGDNPENATPLSIPSNVNGTIEREEDHDWFSFNSAGGLNYRFELAPGNGTGAIIRLYENDGLTKIAEAPGNSGAPAVLDWSAVINAAYFIEIAEEPAAAASSVEVPANTYALRSSIVGRVPGDYDGDANVDGHDFLTWQQHVGSTTDLSADGDNDGVVGGSDLEIWRTNFGLIFGGPASSAVAAATYEAEYETRSGWAAAEAPHVLSALNGVSLSRDALSGNSIGRTTESDSVGGATRTARPPMLAGVRDEVLKLWSNDRADPLRSAAQPLTPLSKAIGELRADGLTESLGEYFDAAITRLFGRR